MDLRDLQELTAGMPAVALKYCGLCNPQIDLGRLGTTLTGLAVDLGARLVRPNQEYVDLVIILCGCPRACGNRPEVRARARRVILIAGNSVNGKAVGDCDLAQHLLNETEIALRSGADFCDTKEEKAEKD